MTRSHNIIKLFVAAFTVAIISSCNIDAMEHPRNEDERRLVVQQPGVGIGQVCQHIEENMWMLTRNVELEEQVFPEIAMYIFHLNSEISKGIDLITHASHDPEDLYCVIGWVYNKFGSDLSAEIVRTGLNKAGKSLFDVKEYGSGGTVLHCMGTTHSGRWSTAETVKAIFDFVRKISGDRAGDRAWELLCMQDNVGNTALHCVGITCRIGVAEGLLAVAGMLGKDKTWEFLCMKDKFYKYGSTALHVAILFTNPKIVKMFLDQADKLGEGKAWELIVMSVGNGDRGSWNRATNEIRAIMEQYRPSDK